MNSVLQKTVTREHVIFNEYHIVEYVRNNKYHDSPYHPIHLLIFTIYRIVLMQMRKSYISVYHSNQLMLL